MTEKYIVFKLEDGFVRGEDPYMSFDAIDAIDDAVVIRRQDLFAAPALHVYSHTIAIAAKMMRADLHQTKNLMAVADYFHEQAVLAEEEGFKAPD